MSFTPTTAPSNLDSISLTPTTTTTAADKTTLATIFQQRNQIIQWFTDVSGNGRFEALKGFLSRWSANSLARDLTSTNPHKSVNAYIYRTITTLQPLADSSTTTTTPTNDPLYETLCRDVQVKAVEFLLSSIGWRNTLKGNRIENRLQLHFASTFVDWPTNLDLPPGTPKPTSGVSYGGKNYYRMTAADISSWFLGLYRTQGPAAMYTALQSINFVPPAPAGSPADALAVITNTLLVASNKSQVVALYTDPARPNDKANSHTVNVWYLRTLGDWARLQVAAYVLQGL